ncbi:Uncharacterized protein APZ42_024100 [Daphnia magna]|uniref:Uncharacterized protein n=1 Tax=Daphnia magna TaxID=35525 RepID=A0A164UED7_9CRUS|nr:Uncharacterized protein APZ42_024100 [Daphnia magna]
MYYIKVYNSIIPLDHVTQISQSKHGASSTFLNLQCRLEQKYHHLGQEHRQCCERQPELGGLDGLLVLLTKLEDQDIV